MSVSNKTNFNKNKKYWKIIIIIINRQLPKLWQTILNIRQDGNSCWFLTRPKEGGGCMSPFQPLVYIRDQWVEKCSMWRFMWKKREFYGVIWRCFARVMCGNIMSGFGKCCDCRESHSLCDLPKVLTDKSQVCAVELVLLEYFVSSIKTLREYLVPVILS